MKKRVYDDTQTTWLKIITGLLGVIMLILLVSAIAIVPKTVRILNNADDAIKNAETIMQDAQKAISVVNEVAGEIDDADLPGLVEDTKTLINSGNKGIETAMGKVEDIKIDELNDAIVDLKTIVEPLAKLLGK